MAACLVLIATSITIPSAAASAPDPGVKGANLPTTASLSAKPAPSEVPGLRTAYSNTYDNHDGTFTAHVSPGPINYLPKGQATYQPIDLTFAATGKANRLGVTKTAVPVQVGKPKDSAGFLSVDTGQGIISLGLPSDTLPGSMVSVPTAAAKGEADVAGLLPGVDLRVFAQPTGFGTYLVLDSQPASSSFTFALDTGGLTPVLRDGGWIDFLNASGSVVATMPTPYAVDSEVVAGEGGPVPAGVASYSLTTSGSETLLTVSLDSAWLANATYPVYVDPTVTVSGAGSMSDTFISSKYPGTNWEGYHRPDSPYYYELLLGVDPGDHTSNFKTLMKFTLPSAVLNSVIDSASLQIFPYHQYQLYATVDTWVDKVTSSWSAGSVNWNTAPSSVALTVNGTKRGYTGSFNVQSAVQEWANTPTSNYGFLLHEDGKSYGWWKRLIAVHQGGVNIPALVIRYHIPVVSSLVPAGATWTKSRVLSWAFSDPTGLTQTAYKIELDTHSDFSSPILTTGPIAGVNTRYMIPTSTVLTDGTTYYWRVAGSNGTQWSNWAAESFKWDQSAPTWGAFTAPTSQVTQSGAAYTFTWSAAGGGATIASYAVQLQSSPISSTPNVCAGNWANVGSPVTVTAASYPASGFAPATCYRVAVAPKDSAGNVGTVTPSLAVLVDTTQPGIPVVVDDATVPGNTYSSNYTIYYRKLSPRTITLTSTGTDPQSGIVSSTFSALSAPTGWTYTAGTVTGNPASKTITPTSTANQTTLTVTTKNGAGTNSSTITLTFVPIDRAQANFAIPDEGTTTIISPSASLNVTWVEYQGGSAISGRSLQRQKGTPGGDGLCGSTSDWADDGSPNTAVSPVTESGLSAGYCYRWKQTLTDTLSATYTSGAVVVDDAAPSASLTYPAPGQPLSGAVTISGVASDQHLSNYLLEYGSGTSPSSWTAIASSPIGVSSSGPLAGWTTNGLNGVYTLRLTATDFAGNSTAVTSLVYIDNSQRGSDAYYTRVPFDLGGGWNLGVNVATGEASLTRDLFSIASYGPAQALSLAYNSADTGTAGQFGAGWSSNLTQYLSFESGFVVWHRPDGGRVPFGQVGSAWTPLVGHYEKLASGSGTYVITLRNQTTLTFEDSGAGRLTAITDRFGKALTLAWSTDSATATDASGRATNIAIDSANHRITDVTDSAGRHWGFAYTGSNLADVTDPASKVTTLSYGTYDEADRLDGISRQRTPYGGSAATVVWSINYDGSHRVTSVTDPIGGATNPVGSSTISYGSGTSTVQILADVSAPAAPLYNTSNYLWDSRGWVTWSTDPNGWAQTATYDANGNVLTFVRQATAGTSATTTLSYDGNGNVLQTTDPVGSVTVNTYNATNDPLSVTRASGQTYALQTAYVYDAAGHLCRKVVNPTAPGSLTCTSTVGGNADQNIDTQYTYDSNNQLLTETNPLGVVTRYGHDTRGNLTSVARNYVADQSDDSTSVTTTYAYDQNTIAGKAGLPTSTTQPITTIAPALSRTITDTYDVFGNVLTELLPDDSNVQDQKTVSAYDEFGSLVSTSVYSPSESGTALSSATTVYDGRGRATTETSTSQAATTWTTTTYDVAGDALTVSTSEGTVAIGGFDGLGQCVYEQSSGQDATTHVFDGLGDEVTTVGPAPDMDTMTTTRTFNLAGQMTAETVDTGGTPATTTYVLDLLGREASSTDSAGLTTTTAYDGVGRVISSVVDPGPEPHLNLVTNYAYDKAGRKTAMRSPTGTVATTAYDGLSRTTQTIANCTDTDPGTLPGTGWAGCTAAGVHDATWNLTTTTAFDAAGETVAVKHPAGSVTRSWYSIRGEVITALENCTDTDPGTLPGAAWAACVGDPQTSDQRNPWNGRTTYNVTSDGATLTSTTTAVDGVTTTTVSDGAGLVLSTVIDPGSSPHLNLATDHAYDSSGREKATRSRWGSPLLDLHVVTTTVYDSQGRVAQTIANCTDTDPGTLPGTGWADCAGAGVHDATWNQVTSYTYDDAGNKTSETAPNGTITAYAYDNKGQLISETDNFIDGYVGADPTINVLTRYYYDAAGRLIATASPTSTGSYTIIRDVYDSLGRLTQEILNCTSSGTTPDANPATCTGAGTKNASTNVSTSYTYDAVGNRVSMVAPSPANAAGGTSTVTTRYAYDKNTRLCRVLEAASVDLQTLADPCTTPVSGSATSNVSTRYDYDANGNLWHQIAPSPAGTTTYAYDALGHLSAQTVQTAAGPKMTSWTYDGAGHKVGQTDPDTSTGPTLSWSYDAAGRLCRRIAAAGVALQDYSDPCTHQIATATIDTRYAYDTAGNVTGVTDALTERTITTTYDQLNRPLTVSGDTAGDPGTTYTYDFVNPTRTDASGTYSISIDAYGRQASLIDPIHPEDPFSWTYAASGAVATQTDPTNNVTSNTFDPLGRLTGRTTTGATGCTNCAVYTFTFNNAGNVVSRASTISGATGNGTTTFAYDILDRLTTYTPPAALQSGVYTWNPSPDRASIKIGTGTTLTTQFDPASRPTSDSGGGQYTNDGQGRLTSMTSTTPARQMTYDALGRLTAVRDGSGNPLASYSYDALDRLRAVTEGSITTRFRYVGASAAVAQEINDSSGVVIVNHATDASGTVLMDFDAGGNLQRYYGRNGHGDVTWTSGATGAVSATAAYTPFGELAASTGGFGTTVNTRWQSSWQDPGTGFYYAQARWYAPTLGRFLSTDPLEGQLLAPQSRSLYAYGVGDSVNNTDPDGRCAQWVRDGTTPYYYCAKQDPPPALARIVASYKALPVKVNVPFFSQQDPRWAKNMIGRKPVVPNPDPKRAADYTQGCGESMKSLGCLITSLAMISSYYRRLKGSPPLDPGTLNDRYGAGRAITIGGDYNCSLGRKKDARIAGLSSLSDPQYLKDGKGKQVQATSFGQVPPGTLDLVAKELSKGYPVLGRVKTSYGPHFFVIVGMTQDDILINDPAKLAAAPTGLFGSQKGMKGYRLLWINTIRP